MRFRSNSKCFTVVQVLFVLFVFCVFAGNVPAMAKSWISLTGGNQESADLRVISSRGYGTVINTVIPGLILSDVAAGEGISSHLSIPGASHMRIKSYPELPKLTAFVAIPHDRDANIRVVDIQWEEFKLDRPLTPSKGPLLRTVNPDDVPYIYGAVYGMDEFFPPEKDMVTVGKPFVLRDVRGVRLSVIPCRYNPVTETLLVAKKLTFAVDTTVRTLSVFKPKNTHVPPDYVSLYDKVFINREFVRSRYAAQQETGRVLIIAADEFCDAVLPLRDWRLKSGFLTEVVKASDIVPDEEGRGDVTSADIAACIKNRYDQGNLGYVILVGDYDTIPTLLGTVERAASDPCYTKLEGDDHIPDCFISRISAESVADVENQVARFIGYERNPLVDDADWYEKSTGIASNEGNPRDWERADWLRDGLLEYGYSVVDKIYDPRAPKDKLTAAINQGRSSINYIGHGSRTSWVTSRFYNSDVDKLKNGWKLPLIWSVACVNGAFTYRYGDCFAERWMKIGSADNPQGAIGIFAASTNAEWVPPCDMQYEIVMELTIGEKMTTCGGMATNGILKAMEIWGDGDGQSGVRIMEQYNFFGDVSLTPRTRKPVKLDVAADATGGQLKITVTSGSQPFEGARVTLYNSDLSGWMTVSANKSGAATFTIARTEALTKILTVTGFNAVPMVDYPVESLLAENE